jgi:hypothetical protein
VSPDSLPPSKPERPGRVLKLHGIIVQSDKTSWLGAWLIRPVEMLDLHLAGIGREVGSEPLAMHAGLRVELEDGGDFVVEQLFGSPRENFVSGLNWTPLETFRARDHAGWDATIPATCFRKINEQIVSEVVDFLNRIEGRPFFGEDCTGLVERAFGKRRLFADSPTARTIGFGMRIGDPALMLLDREARLDPKTEIRIRADILRALPDPTEDWDAPNGHAWIKRGVMVLGIFALAWGFAWRLLRTRIPSPELGAPNSELRTPIVAQRVNPAR